MVLVTVKLLKMDMKYFSFILRNVLFLKKCMQRTTDIQQICTMYSLHSLTVFVYLLFNANAALCNGQRVQAVLRNIA